MHSAAHPPRHRSRPATPRPPRRAAACALEAVEARRLFHTSAPVVDVPDVYVASGAAPTVVDLSQSFNVAANRTRVAFGFDVGRVVVELYEDAAPLTVANFLNYARTDRYDNTVVHRSAELANDEPFVLQGGGYRSPDLSRVAADPPVINEFRANTVQRGTIAMAKLGNNPNSATSEWFFNLRDNREILDPQNGGFASFGEVVGNGMALVDAIAGLPTITQGRPPSSPLFDFPILVNPPASPQDWVDVQYIAELPEVTAVTTDNPALVTPVLQGTTLTLNYAGGTGIATVTVSGVDRLGAAVTESFRVGVDTVPLAPPYIEVPIGTGAARGVTYTDADGTTGTITVTGGTATVRLNGASLTQAPAGKLVNVTGSVESVAVTTTGGTPAVTVRGAGGDGELVVSGVAAPGAVRSFSGRNVVLRGPADFAGGVGRLELLRAEGATLTVGGADSSISIGTATDTDLTAAGAIRQLRLGSWGGSLIEPDVITAPAVGTLQAAGNFSGTLAIAGPVNSVRVKNVLAGNLTAGSVRSLRAGSVTNSVITLTQAPGAGLTNLGSMNVAGAIGNTRVRSAGNIGTVAAGEIQSSSILAGVTISVPALLPISPADFTPGVSVRGVTVRKRSAPSFVNSAVVAASLGRMNLGVVNTVNLGRHGLAALEVASVAATDQAGDPIRARRLDDPADDVIRGNFEIRVF